MPASLVAWLLSDERIDPTGHCLSWSNPTHPGYPYPEITGLLLSFLAGYPEAADRRQSLAAALANQPDAAAGAGRGGVSYTFDTAMAVRGLIRGASRPQSLELASRWGRLLVRWVEAARATSEELPLTRATHWSDSFGCHQSKVAGALLDLRALGDEALIPDGLDDALELLSGRTLSLQDSDGRFRIHAESSTSYLHSHCYAVEGLLMHDNGLQRWPSELRAAADFLAGVQTAEGGIHSWYDEGRSHGPVRADATAQAVRIFALVDNDGYSAQIAAGRRFLDGLRAPSGGIRYEPESDDVTVWPTIFAAQALADPSDPAGLRHGLDLV